MKERRREMLFLYGVTRFQKIKPRSGIEVQLLMERAQQRVMWRAMKMLDGLEGMGLEAIIQDRGEDRAP